MIRHLLGDSLSTIRTLSPTLVAKYSHHVSALLTTYRLLDLELLHNGPDHPIFTPPTSYSNRVTPQMVEKVKVKNRWKQLENWQELLNDFKKCHNSVSLGNNGISESLEGRDLVLIDESPPFNGSLAHLQGLAESHSNQKFTSLVQNFRGAALHWTALQETSTLNSHKLPVMPETLSGIADKNIIRQLNEKYKPHTREKMDEYLRKHTQGELVLPLHLSLMITPFFLLMQSTLVKSKFPRQSIHQVSVSRILLIPTLKVSSVIMRTRKS